MMLLPVVLSGLCAAPAAFFSEVSFDWIDTQQLERLADGGFRTIGHDPWLLSAPLETSVPASHSVLHLQLQADQDVESEVRWLLPGDSFVAERTLAFDVKASGEVQDYYIDLNRKDSFEGLEQLRFDPSHEAGLEFSIVSMDFLRPEDLPDQVLHQFIEFRGYTSKLHYLPGEPIDYIVRIGVQNYPDLSSAKVLDIYLLDAAGNTVTSKVQQWGIQPGYRIREIPGTFRMEEPLEPGTYSLHIFSTDMRHSLQLQHSHENAHYFTVLAEDDPFVYETPFKYIKDFSIIRSDEGRFHIFSITGDFYDTHEWMPNGQERTLSHGSSLDLRHWDYHRPALSIHNKTYPDSDIRFQDQGVWAPHVIRHDGRYYLFYTSVNTHVSQSISVAMSEDLYHWVEHPDNPVFNLEGVDWAVWERDAWADCRDPMVFEEDGTFYLYVTASVRDGGGTTGAVVVAESQDLLHWDNPQIALKTPPVPESPHVWKSGGRYYMYTSAGGGGVWMSDNPVTGWEKTDVPRMPTQAWADPIPTSAGYAEEVLPLESGDILVAAATFRYFGNSIYLSLFETDADGHPTGYESPFVVKGE